MPRLALSLAQQLIERCTADKKNLMVATAESCTAGLISGAITEVSGSSAVFDRGFVTYSNQSKIDLLGVNAGDLENYGAVSETVARAMAQGALQNSQADITVAVTGIAGPGGGSPKKPVGLVHFSVGRAGKATLHQQCLFGDIGRQAVREKTVETALQMMIDALSSP